MSTDIARGLTEEQLRLLFQPINPTRVKSHKGNPHLEAWDVRRWLTRIFGIAGWSDEILSCHCIHNAVWPYMDNGKAVLGKDRCTAVYRVTLRLTVRDVHGNPLGSWEDGAVGDAINQATIGDAHDLALKAAISQSLKRCAVNLGDQFGISLYNDGHELEQSVIASAAYKREGAPTLDSAKDAPVIGGDLQEGALVEPESHDPRDTALAAPQQSNRQRGALTEVKPDDPDPWQTQPPAEEEMSTRQQQIEISDLFKTELGITDRAEKVRRIVDTLSIDRPVTTTKQLTRAEADRVVTGMRSYRKRRMEHEQLLADLQSGIEGAAGMSELDSAGRGLTDALMNGRITPDDRAALLEVWNARAEALRTPAGETAVA
jgi:hypothetical protein